MEGRGKGREGKGGEEQRHNLAGRHHELCGMVVIVLRQDSQAPRALLDLDLDVVKKARAL